MNGLPILTRYFQSGSADTETDFLLDVFVTSKDFEEIVNPVPRTLRVLVGNKGSGKSALLEYWHLKCNEQHIPSIALTPIDIVTNSFEDNTSPAYVIKELEAAIIDAIATKLGENTSAILSEDSRRLLNTAIEAGSRSPTGLQKFIRVLSTVGETVTNIDFSKMIISTPNTSKAKINAIDNTLSSSCGTFYVLFDDLDQMANAQSGNYYDVIWWTILAFLHVASKLPNIRPIVTVRSEIWRNINRNNNGNRDKIDQVREMVKYIEPTSESMREILRRRLAVCAEHITENPIDNPYIYFFDGENCKIPHSNELRLWEDYIISSSRWRPRDSVQLVKKLADSALHDNRDIIQDVDVENTALQYSQEREEDLVSENADLCPQLDMVIRSFSSFEMQADDMRKFLYSLQGKGRIQLGKEILHLDAPQDVFKLWNLLYNIEFLTPRMADHTQSNRYSFVRPGEDRTLVTPERWNDMQKYSWDIQPCYRIFLISEIEKNKRMQLFSSDKQQHKGKRSKK